MDKKLNYKFTCVNPVKYEITITTEASNKLFNLIFRRAKRRYKKKKGIDIKADPKTIEQFEIDARFYKILKTGMLGKLKEIQKIVKKDGIEILNYKVKGGLFKRNKGGNWDIKLTFGGNYADKR